MTRTAINIAIAAAPWHFESSTLETLRERGLPYNPLHDQGYSSIGDTHSTIPGEGRDGRWAGTDKTECGLHT